jgi:hypothetical protein
MQNPGFNGLQQLLPERRLQIDHRSALSYNGFMKPGTYHEIMGRIQQSKKDELVRSARLPFFDKLALTDAANRSGEKHLVLSETFAEPVLEIIKLFNVAVKQAVFPKYALAGGLAVEYYGAPINTVDADFLVVFPESAGGLLDASVFFGFFQRQGAQSAGEYLILHNSKFQMIPANTSLDREALDDAISVTERGVPFFIVTLENLIALKLRAWRYKDRLHVNHLLDSGAIPDNAKLAAILTRHHLTERWQRLLSERGQG